MTFIIYSKTTPSLCDLLRVPYSTSKYGPGFLHYTRLVTPLQPDITRRRIARQLALQIARQKKTQDRSVFSHIHATLLVTLSVGPSMRPSVTQCEIKPKSDLISISAPAHPYVTDAVVNTALLLMK